MNFPLPCLQVRDLELPELRQLKKLRIVNMAVKELIVNPDCEIAVQQCGNNALAASMCKNAELTIHSATWAMSGAM